MEKELSVIIPFYNEENRINIHDNVLQVINYLNDLGITFEIILVDDCSTDKTFAKLRNFAHLTYVKILHSNRNIGKGESIKLGVSEAEGKYILYMDADLSVPLDYISVFLEKMDTEKCVIASRYVSGAVIKNKRPFFRKILSLFTKNIVIKLCGLNVKDSQCGFKMFVNDSNLCIHSFKTSRWLFDLELLRTMNYLGYEIVEVPVVWDNCKQSTLKSKEAVLSSIKELCILLTKKRG